MKKYIFSVIFLFLMSGVSEAASVSLANTKLSLINGTAFLDLGSSINLAQYPAGTMIKICSVTHSTECATGYIKAAGSAESLDSELLPNSAFDNTTDVSVYQVTVASVAGGQSGNCLEITASKYNRYAYEVVTTSVGALYKMSNYIKKGTGAAVKFAIFEASGLYNLLYVSAALSPADWTNYSAYVIATRTSLNPEWVINDGAATTGLVDTATFKKVLTPSDKGVVIKSTIGGTTENWVSSTFSSYDAYNDPLGYTYTLYSNRTVYLDSTCGTNGDGTTTDCTTGAAGTPGALNTAAGFAWAYGDTLSIKKGTTLRETIALPAVANITVNAYGSGNAPVITGANIGFTWTEEAGSVSGNVYYTTHATLTSENTWEGVWVAGVQQAYSADKPTTGGTNLVWWDAVNKRLYISPATTPDDTNAEVAWRANCITASGVMDRLVITGVKVEKSRGDAIQILGQDADGITISNSTLNYAGFTGTTIAGSGKDGLNLWGDGSSSKYLSNINISNNSFTGNYNCGVELNGVHSGNITGNYCTLNAKCVEFYTDCTTITTSKNYSYMDTARAFWVPTLATSGDADSQTALTFTYNVVITAGNGFDIYEGTDHVFYNNSVYLTGNTTCFYLGWTATTGSATLKNNACYTTGTEYAIVMLGTYTATIDYNLWYAPSATYKFLADGDARTFAVWQGTYGYDVHGYYADPKYTSATDLKLSGGSPAINAGTPVTGLHTVPCTDFEGRNCRDSNPDIGAYNSLQNVILGSGPAWTISGGGSLWTLQ